MKETANRIKALEGYYQKDTPENLWIAGVLPDGTERPVDGWQSMMTGVRIDRLPGEDDETLKERVLAADAEARRDKFDPAETMGIRVFLSYGPGWSVA